MTGNGTSLPDGASKLEGEDAELTEEQIAKNKEAEEAFKVQASCFATACVDNASMQHALQPCDTTYVFNGRMVTWCNVNESYNRQSKVMQRHACLPGKLIKAAIKQTATNSTWIF